MVFIPVFVKGAEGAEITVLGRTIRDLYNIFLMIGGAVALMALAYGGIRFGFSLGDPEAIKEAKSWILSAFIGMMILFGSWSFLEFLAPGFVVDRIIIDLPLIVIEPPPEVPDEPEFRDGIIFYAYISPINQENGNNNGNNNLQRQRVEIYRGKFSHKNLDKFWWDEKIQNFNLQKVQFKNPKDRGGEPIQQYGVIAFEKPGFRGRCKIITKDIGGEGGEGEEGGEGGEEIENLPFRPRSIRTFVMPGVSHHRPGDKLIFFQGNYPFRFGPKPPGINESIIAGLRRKGYNIGYIPAFLYIQNIGYTRPKIEIPDTIMRLVHIDKSETLEKIGPQKNVPLGLPLNMRSHQELSFIAIPTPSYMRFKTNDVGRYLIVLFDMQGNCYLTQQSIVNLRDIRKRQPGMGHPWFFQSLQILELY